MATKLELEQELKSIKIELKDTKKELKDTKVSFEAYKSMNNPNVLEQLKNSKHEVIQNEHKLRKEHTTILKDNEELTKRTTYLENQLNGLTDLFNGIFQDVEEQTLLMSAYAKQANYRLNDIKNRIAKFNRPQMPMDKGGDKQ